MQLTTQRRGGALVVQMTEPRLDAAVAIAFKEAMHAATAGPETRVVLDLSSVGFLDSSGLGAVVSVMKHLGAGRRLELAGLTPPVAKVFRLTRMDSVFLIHPAVPGGDDTGKVTPFAPVPDALRERAERPGGSGEPSSAEMSGGSDPDRPARIHAG
jgi:anti-sigma B factor antagonist